MANIVRFPSTEWGKNWQGLDRAAGIMETILLPDLPDLPDEGPESDGAVRFNRIYSDKKGRKTLHLEVLATGYSTITIDDGEFGSTPQSWEASPGLLETLIDALEDMLFATEATASHE